jgi:autophagy-related protein 5
LTPFGFSADNLLAPSIALLDDFNKFWTVAAKLVPSPAVVKPRGSTDRTSPVLSTTSTFDASRVPDANSMRSIPMRIYLPHGAPVVQDVVPAINPSSGRPATLQSALTMLVPSLMRPGLSGVTDMSASFVAQQKPIPLRVIVQGIELPLETELGWCSACLSYPDGWLGVVIDL